MLLQEYFPNPRDSFTKSNPFLQALAVNHEVESYYTFQSMCP